MSDDASNRTIVTTAVAQRTALSKIFDLCDDCPSSMLEEALSEIRRLAHAALIVEADDASEDRAWMEVERRDNDDTPGEP